DDGPSDPVRARIAAQSAEWVRWSRRGWGSSHQGRDPAPHDFRRADGWHGTRGGRTGVLHRYARDLYRRRRNDRRTVPFRRHETGGTGDDVGHDYRRGERGSVRAGYPARRDVRDVV